MELVKNKELAEILGLDFEADEGLEQDYKEVKEIQVCAGTWRRLDAETWTFDADPEW